MNVQLNNLVHLQECSSACSFAAYKVRVIGTYSHEDIVEWSQNVTTSTYDHGAHA